jgi:glycosyltransferase involved in cell wall biosynthesis
MVQKMDMTDMKKVVLITNIPNPYRIPLFNELDGMLKSSGISFKVIFGAPGYSRRMFKIDESEMKFQFRILDDQGHTFSDDGEKTVFLYKGLNKALNEEKPDLIIVSGFSPATMKVYFRKLIKGTPYIIWNGSIPKQADNKFSLRKLQRKLLCKHASAFVSYGHLAAKYLINSGAAPKSVFVAINTVDTVFFSSETELKREQQKSIKHQLPVFLVLGYLVPRKQIHQLLEAVKILSEKRIDFQVAVLGDGISKQSLIDYVKENQLEQIVTFHGFVQKNDLPGWFARSRALLFQTGYDIWGLVVNEAMAAGVPVLSSVNAGATHDLITDGENGFRADYKNYEETAAKIEWLINHPAEAAAMGAKARDYIWKNASLHISAMGFNDAIKHALDK